MLWTRSKTGLPWGRNAAVRVFLYPKTDCYSLTNSFSIPCLGRYEVFLEGQTPRTRVRSNDEQFCEPLYLWWVSKLQIEWNGRWQKGWSDFLVTNFYTRQDRQQHIGMRACPVSDRQFGRAVGGVAVLARQTRFNMSTNIRGHSRPPKSVSNGIECCFKSYQGKWPPDWQVMTRINDNFSEWCRHYQLIAESATLP